MWTFAPYNNWNDIWNEKHLNRWNELLNNSPTAHVFFHPALAKAWVDTYLPLRNLEPIFIWGKATDGNEVFLPLVLWRRNWKSAFMNSIIPVGYSDFDYHDPIFQKLPTENTSFWNELLCYLKHNYRVDNILITGINEKYTDSARQWHPEDTCPFLQLTDIRNNEDLMLFFRTSLRGDIRRQIRRLEELGKLEFKEYQSFENAESTFSTFMNEHASKWPNAYKAPFLHTNLVKNIHGNIVHFSSININKKPIAWHLGFSFQNIYYYYMPAGHHDYLSFSPVKIHLYYLINRAVKLGYHKYDHLKGEENYKAGWSNGCNSVFQHNWNNTQLTTSLKTKINQSIRTLFAKQ